MWVFAWAQPWRSCASRSLTYCLCDVASLNVVMISCEKAPASRSHFCVSSSCLWQVCEHCYTS
jgi:hypothetical protein